MSLQNVVFIFRTSYWVSDKIVYRTILAYFDLKRWLIELVGQINHFNQLSAIKYRSIAKHPINFEDFSRMLYVANIFISMSLTSSNIFGAWNYLFDFL